MKIVVIGGTGNIGRRVVSKLTSAGHDVVAASPSEGIDSYSGRGLATALMHAEVVIDVSNAPPDGSISPMEFFTTSTRNLLDAGTKVGVRHHVLLSIVGIDRMTSSDYYAAKLAQERLVQNSALSYTIIRSTQFFDFVDMMFRTLSDQEPVRLPPVVMQPIASDDAASIISDVAVGEPMNQTIEVAGPHTMNLVDMMQTYLAARGEPRTVLADATVPFFGLPFSDVDLLPRQPQHTGTAHFTDWLSV
jgi:uncharacterized protein YbjT (DUF2867 family)